MNVESRIAGLSTGQRKALAGQLAVLNSEVPVQPSRGERLVAHVVLREGEHSTAEDLRGHLNKTLPAHMIPDAFVFSPSLPRTPNGKVDRRALALLAPSGSSADDDYVAPRNPVENVLCTTLAEVLERPRVGAQDDFFGLGGHSLQAIRAVSKIRELLHAGLRIPDFFELRTPAALAQHLLSLPDRHRIKASAELLLEVAQLSESEVDAMLDGQHETGN